MTISVQTPRSGPYSGDGSTVAFAYGFLIDDESELVVVVADANGDETTKVLTTDYTVSGVGNNGGGTVTFNTAPTATETVAIRRATVLDQSVDLQNRGAVVPQVLEDVYDEIVKMVQDHEEQLARAILMRITTGTTAIDLPAPEASKLLGWDAAGTELENKTINTSAYITTPASVTDNRLVRFDGTSGEAFQESGVTVDDNGSMSMSTINIDNLNTRLGIGDISPDTDVDIYTATPTIRLQESGADGIADVSLATATYLIDIDAADAIASSAFHVDIDNVNRLALDTESLDVNLTGSIKVPVGTTGQRPSTPAQGDIRRNTTTSSWEGYDGSSWGNLGGAGLFKGENGESGDTVLGAGDIFRVHEQTLNTDTTIDADENALAAGPLTVASGITLTITSGGNLSIV